MEGGNIRSVNRTNYYRYGQNEQKFVERTGVPYFYDDPEFKRFVSFRRKRNVQMCKNCGLFNHSIRQCKKPILSYGIICFKVFPDGIKYLLVQRKHSIQFISFTRGQYDLTIKGYPKLCSMFSMMTMEEKEKLRMMTFDELMVETSTNVAIKRFEDERRRARKQFEDLKKGVFLKGSEVTLDTLCFENDSIYDEPEWGVPKGRRNIYETDEECARREFKEETNYINDDYIILNSFRIITENILGTNGKPYRYKYFVARFRSNYEPSIDPLNNFQKVEVRDIRWISLNDAKNVHIPESRTDILKDLNRYLIKSKRYPIPRKLNPENPVV